ncbi:hypothetical protein C0995_005541 [Termitomyces sp. Mi166|nr:hypothetical protein C0995_005541 [Termitomyces sp. Mi166\
MTKPVCVSGNKDVIDQSSFWDSNGVNWDPHRIGWAIAGGCTVVVSSGLPGLLGYILDMTICRRSSYPLSLSDDIAGMSTVRSKVDILSLLYRNYTNPREQRQMLLLIEYVAATASGHKAENAIARKNKHPLPLPISTDQVISIIGIICEKYDVLCESAGFSVYYANVYLEAVDFVSITIALYGLLLFYGLMSEELKGRRPLAKFMCIKLIVMFTFYQSFVFNALEGRVIKGLMMWAYTPAEYKKPGTPPTSIWRPLWDSINYSDFAREIWGSLRFFFTGKMLPSDSREKMTFGKAFGLDGHTHTPGNNNELVVRNTAAMQSYDEHIHLAAYESHASQETPRVSMQERYTYRPGKSS